MKKTLILALLVTVVAGFTLSCCNPERMAERMIEQAMEAEGDGDVDIDFGGGSAPKDLPKDLIYKGAKIMGSFSMNSEEGSGSTVMMETSASVSRVIKYYEGLDSKGYEVEATFSGMSEGEEGTMLALSKGDFGALITVAEEEGNTAIVIIYGEDFATE